LAGKTALVTGASRGIGKAIAIHLARKGLTNIAITYAANESAAIDTLEACRALGVQKAISIKANLLDSEIWSTIVKQALDALGVNAIDILVNNAFLGDHSYYKTALELTSDNFSDIMRANCYAPVANIIAFMKHAAPKSGGRVINISSLAAILGNREPEVTYGASKAALNSFVRSLAEGYSTERGITFNSVLVGPTATDNLLSALPNMPPEIHESFIKGASAAARLGNPEDIAYIVGFLASEEGRWVNGAAISANGGYRMALAALG
jgi:3-oxoacyl-[acyl-carrier protein] reductase